MASRDRTPLPGDYVECPDEFDLTKAHTGTVDEILSIQFTYVDHMKVKRFCFFKEAWLLIE